MQTRIGRRDFLTAMGLGAGALALASHPLTAEPAQEKPNVILCMADDLGWGDTGYNGHPFLKTPNLDAMANAGLRFNRFYSGAPVCSPTRGSAITGRHPYRYGVFTANAGHMRKEEVTLAEVLKTQGYATGHFGKWHLGTLTTKIRESNRGGPGSEAHYAPPWDNGFDVCFSTEAKVPTYNPMRTPESDAAGAKGKQAGEPFGTHYWDGPESIVTENLEGDDSRIILDRAILFIRKAAGERKPFLAAIWFHAPHLPTVAGPSHMKMYEGKKGSEYFGCITAMDEQVGRLRATLRELGVADNTMLWFCSDNGPEGQAGELPGSAGPLRGRKRSLFEGGVRVPGLLEWPARIRKPRTTDMPSSTLDYFPTILDALGYPLQGRPEPIDGVSLLPMISDKMDQRPRPIGFESGKQVSLIDNRYKIVSQDGGKTYMLFDIVEDASETTDLAKEKPEIVAGMRKTAEDWRASCKASLAGEDYRKSV